MTSIHDRARDTVRSVANQAGEVALSPLDPRTKREALVDLGKRLYDAAFLLRAPGAIDQDVQGAAGAIAGMLRNLHGGDALVEALVQGFAPDQGQRATLAEEQGSFDRQAARDRDVIDKHLVDVHERKGGALEVLVRGRTSTEQVQEELLPALARKYPDRELRFFHPDCSHVELSIGSDLMRDLAGAGRLELASTLGAKFPGIKSLDVREGALIVGVTGKFPVEGVDDLIALVRTRYGDVSVKIERRRTDEPIFAFKGAAG